MNQVQIDQYQLHREVYHLDGGVRIIEKSLQALNGAGIDTIPHIVTGLHYGKILGEYKAIEMLVRFNPEVLVFVSLTSFKGTPMEYVEAPSPQEIVDLICEARFRLPESIICLGCERSRGLAGFQTEMLAIDSGINRIAIQSDYALEHARNLGLEVDHKETCCSIH